MNEAKGICELKVGGAYYGGWRSVSITRSIEQVAGTFELEVTERWAGQPEANPIKLGAPCQVLLDGDPVITGYVDDVLPEYDDKNHTVTIKGRDKTGDLVDCSADYKSGKWSNATLDGVAGALIKPFGIDLKVEVPLGASYPSFKIEQGETVFECLERFARMKAVLLISDTEGNLVIARASSEVVDAPLIEGRNILSASGNFSWKDRYSTYTVKGQGKADDDFFEEAVGPRGMAKDETIDRYRPRILHAEEHGHGATLKQRAEWEKNVRMGRGNRGTITVQGWRRPDGQLWFPNVLVHVLSPRLRLDADMLIVGCTWKLDDKGTTTQLSIARREAFELVSGVGMSKLDKKLHEKERREKRGKAEDWSML